MSTTIKFGTSGWRAVVADEFTLANVRRALTGIARYLLSRNPSGPSAVLGRDTRFMGETLVETAIDVLTSHGIAVLVVNDAVPTPAVAYAVIATSADGAVNFTASHNPPEYNGIKFSTHDGAPALPEVTSHIEREILATEGTEDIVPAAGGANLRSELDARTPYLKRLAEIIDFKAVAKSGMRVGVDPMWGTARGYTDTVLRDHGIDAFTVHDHRDVLFGGHAPEPDDHLLAELMAAMKSNGARLGIATDGDADRFGIVDQDGAFLQPNYIIALLFDYLVETRGWKNGVAKSVATTNMVNALAEHHGVELFETPVGFKYIGELIQQDKIAIGGEESAGLSIRHHVPEKDGILAGLLCCEMVAVRGTSLREQLRGLFGKVGSFYPQRENFRLTDDVKAKFTAKVQLDDPELLREAGAWGKKISKIVRTDGLKLVFDDGAWVCYRLSGTEPVVRVYTEARSQADVGKLAAASKDWVFKH